MKNKEFFLPIVTGAVLTVAASTAMLFINKICALLSLGQGIALLLLFAYYTHRRFKKLDELNNYLSLVCAGNYELDISDNTEGELSILKNNLYKVILLLKSSNEALQKDKVYLADALADISHQLKTPLTSMTVITDLLKEEQQPQKREEFISIIDSQLTKMRWLIQTLLKLSKIDAGTAVFSLESVSAAEVIDQSIQPFLIALDLKNIELDMNITDFTFNGDGSWSAEALQNILKNCIEHIPEGGRIEIHTSQTPLFDEISISDNGSGIDSADLPHIFERFYRGKNADNDSVGIGLALAKSILKNQNASVAAESENGNGTKFLIRFYKAVV